MIYNAKKGNQTYLYDNFLQHNALFVFTWRSASALFIIFEKLYNEINIIIIFLCAVLQYYKHRNLYSNNWFIRVIHFVKNYLLNLNLNTVTYNDVETCCKLLIFPEILFLHINQAYNVKPAKTESLKSSENSVLDSGFRIINYNVYCSYTVFLLFGPYLFSFTVGFGYSQFPFSQVVIYMYCYHILSVVSWKISLKNFYI